jgi:hypothetical protein
LTPLRSATVFSLVFAAFDLVVAESFGPCDQRPAAAHFVVLDGLCVGDDGGIKHGLVFDLARGLLVVCTPCSYARPAALFARSKNPFSRNVL